MQIQIWSDIHVDFWKIRWRNAPGIGQADTLICAGDLGEFHRAGIDHAVEWLCQQYKAVYYVPGNHDDYHADFGYAAMMLKHLETRFPNLTVLRTGETHQLGEYKIVGDTGWIPDNVNLLKYPINDVRMIRDLRPAIHDHHSNFKKFLYDVVDEKTIVVNHHLPAWPLVAPQYAGDPWNIWFVGDCEDIIKEKKPALFVSGHTHHAYDVMLHATRMVCNPLGYPAENGPILRGPVTITI